MLNTKLTKTLLHTTDKYIDALNKWGIITVYDFLKHFPRDYDDRTNVLDTFSLINIKDKNTILVKLLSIDTKKTSNNKILTKAIIEDKNWFLSECVWFNRKYLASQLMRITGSKILISWKVKYDYWKLSFNSPEVETNLSKVGGDIMPIYSDINYIPSKWIIPKIELLKTYISSINEIIPEKINNKYNFISRKEAFYKIHFPKNKNDIKIAREKLWYDELYDINYKAISIKYKKQEITKWQSISVIMNSNLIKEIISKLDFDLTNHQKIVLFQVLKDMEKVHWMRRLLEWDVWTWKTIVSLISLIHFIIEGKKLWINTQAALMAPT